jgi:hypothetical protein
VLYFAAVTEATTPPQPDQPEAPPPPPTERKWIPTLSVFVLVVVVSLGGFIVGGEAGQAVTEPGPEPNVAAIEVVPGVFVPPVSGWEFVGPLEGEIAGGRITRGSATLDVFEGSLEGSGVTTNEDLFFLYIFDILQPQASQLRYTEQLETVTVGAHTAARGYYVGTFSGVSSPVEGEVTAVTLPSGVGVIFDGWASEGQLGVVIEEIRTMIELTEIVA